MARILVVDDNASLRTLLVRCLVAGGHEPVVAVDGQEAIDKLETGDVFDLVMTDYAMPGVTGLDVLAAAHRIDPTLPCVLVTAFHDSALETAALAAGAAELLPKPFKLNRLIETVSRLLRPR